MRSLVVLACIMSLCATCAWAGPDRIISTGQVTAPAPTLETLPAPEASLLPSAGLPEDSAYVVYPKARRFKSRIVAIALCAGLGITGAHRYYLGARKAKLTLGYLGLNVVMWFIDLTVLSVDGIDRFLFTDRFFAGVDQ
jgi:hypothetical protein